MAAASSDIATEAAQRFVLKVTLQDGCFRRDDVEALLCCPGRAGVIVDIHGVVLVLRYL